MYILVKDNIAKLYSLAELKRDNPNTSFPKNPTTQLLASRGIYPVSVLAHPTYDLFTQRIVHDDPQNIDGAWVITWIIEQLPQEKAGENIRLRRNELLSECDWTQVADAQVDQVAWATYRQALRDLPSQDGFPYSVIWPTPPA